MDYNPNNEPEQNLEPEPYIEDENSDPTDGDDVDSCNYLEEDRSIDYDFFS